MGHRVVLLALAAAVLGSGVTTHTQGAAPACLVVQERGTAERWAGSAAECATRLSPASTYKIPHALVGLETGAINEMTVEKWDGVRHPDQPKWNQDHTVFSAMRPSVLWFFQRMVPRIGATRARQWLEKFDYGNRDTSGDLTLYWVNGTLRISPDEQLAFLKKFYDPSTGSGSPRAESRGDGTLPVLKAHSDRVKAAMEQQAGTVENARGVHKLAASWRKGITLNSKTGATTIASGESTSWLVGELTVDQRKIVFVSAVWRAKGGVEGLDATTLAIKTFVDRGILPR